MVAKEYLLEEPLQPWIKDTNPDQPFYKSLCDRMEGGPFAGVTILREGAKIPAHFHSQAQFQVFLEGSVGFPDHALKAIAVHYADPYTPYGPFIPGVGFKMAILRARSATITWMSDREGRKSRNPHGRDMHGSSEDVPWEDLTDLGPSGLRPGRALYGSAEISPWENLAGPLAGIRRGVLFGADNENSPKAQIWECPSGAVLPRHPAPHGEYDILLAGSGHCGDARLEPYSMRFVVGDETPTPLIAGDEGASWLTLTFDQAAAGKPT